MNRYIAVVAAGLILVMAAPPSPALATNVVCTVNNGAINGSDSLGGAFPGADNPPPGDTGTYSVDNVWHNSTEYEWCGPSHDWFKETNLRWSAAAATKLKNERASRTIQVEQNVIPPDSYNYTGGHDSDLPYTFLYVAPVAEQWLDGYEDVGFGVYDPGLIVAGVNYHAYLQWEQEADGGILDYSPLLNYVECKVTYGDKLFGLINYDVIGHWSKKITNNK